MIQRRSQGRTSWVDHILRPGLDPDTVPFFILGTHKGDKSCMPHVLVRTARDATSVVAHNYNSCMVGFCCNIDPSSHGSLT